MWIQKVCANPVVKCSLNIVLFAVLFCRIPVNLYPAPFKVKLPFTTSIEDTETTVTMEMKTSAVKKAARILQHAQYGALAILTNTETRTSKTIGFISKKTTLRGHHTFRYCLKNEQSCIFRFKNSRRSREFLNVIIPDCEVFERLQNSNIDQLILSLKF